MATITENVEGSGRGRVPAREPLPAGTDGHLVLERLREALTSSRHAGEDFRDAWPAAVAVALPADARMPPVEFESWRIALEGTILAWRAAYTGDRAPTPAELAVRRIVDASDDDRETVELDLALAA